MNGILFTALVIISWYAGNTGQWHVLTNLNVVVAIPLVTAVGKERIDGVVTGLGDHFSLVKTS